MDPTATPCRTFSHVQLDPIQEEFSLENAEAHRSQSSREFQGMMQASQEQIRDCTPLLHEHSQRSNFMFFAQRLTLYSHRRVFRFCDLLFL